MNEKSLKILFSYGFITKSEQERLLKKFRVDGLSRAVKIDILEALEKTVARLEDEEAKLDRKRKEAAKKMKKADDKLRHDIDVKYDRILAERKEEVWRRKKRKASAMREIFDEIERFERRLAELDREIEQEIEGSRLTDIRKRLE